MKKRITIAGIIIALLILLVPIPRRLKDGGTVEYQSLTYKISKVHRRNSSLESGYEDGIIIQIFGKQVYSSVSKNIENANKDKDTDTKYFKTIENIRIEIVIPREWQYEELSRKEENDFYKYALKLYKSGSDKVAILYFYHDPFGVCGTGRTDKEMTLNNGEKANIGYYSDPEWSDISFSKLYRNIAIINYGLKGNEAEEFLDFVKTITIEQLKS